jgi:anti-anti-sigma factor
MTTQPLQQVGPGPAGPEQRGRLSGPAASVVGYDGVLIATVSSYTEATTRDGLLTVAVDGDVDRDSAPLLHGALMEAITARPRVCCDMSEVAFLSAAGIAALLAAHGHADSLGHSFFLRGVRGLPAQVLRIAGTDRVIATDQ